MNDATISAMNQMIMAHHFGRTPVERNELDELQAIYARWLNNEIATNSPEMLEVISAVPRLLKIARTLAAREALLTKALDVLEDHFLHRRLALAAEIAAALGGTDD